MYVAPDSELPTVDISVGHVHSSDISHTTVNQAKFAVVAPVDAGTKMQKRYLEERIHLNPGFAHAAVKLALHLEIAEMVIDYFYLHPRLCFAYKYVGYSVSYPVIFKYIILQIDKTPRTAQILHQYVKLLLPVVKYPSLVIFIIRRPH